MHFGMNFYFPSWRLDADVILSGRGQRMAVGASYFFAPPSLRLLTTLLGGRGLFGTDHEPDGATREKQSLPPGGRGVLRGSRAHYGPLGSRGAAGCRFHWPICRQIGQRRCGRRSALRQPNAGVHLLVNFLRRTIATTDSSSRDAIANALHELAPDVQRWCARHLGPRSDLEDAVQEALIAVADALTRFRNESSMRTYAYRIVLRSAYRYRTQHREAQRSQQLHVAGC